VDRGRRRVDLAEPTRSFISPQTPRSIFLKITSRAAAIEPSKASFWTKTGAAKISPTARAAPAKLRHHLGLIKTSLSIKNT
jgi:hypothetical protein